LIYTAVANGVLVYDVECPCPSFGCKPSTSTCTVLVVPPLGK
jgi:hypothetical protein